MARRKNPYLKQAHEVTEYTPHQVQELMRCANDPVYFTKHYIKIIHPLKGSVPFELYDYQEEMLRDMQANRFTIVLSARQTGKSTVSCAFLLWFAIFHENKYILISSNKNSSAMEMIARITYAYEQLPNWMKPGVDDQNWNKHQLAWDNGSTIVAEATSEDTGRGKSVSLLYCDELAFVRPSVQEAMWTSIFPTLSTGGAAIISSTPNGDSNLFAGLWRKAESGNSEFKPIFIHWQRPPNRDEKFKQEQIAVIGELKWKQEYECIFVSSEPMLFDSVQLLNLMSAPGTQDHRGVTWWKQFERNKTYLLGVDPATGCGNDFSVIQIFSFPDLAQVAEFRSNTTSSSQLFHVLKHIMQLARKAGIAMLYYSVENNGVGEGVISLLLNDENPIDQATFITEEGSKRDGMTTNDRNKMRACLNFKSMIEKRKMTVFSSTILVEMKNFIRHRGAYAANRGATDDCIAATLIVIRLLNEISMYEQSAFDALYNTVDEDEYDSNDMGLPVMSGGGRYDAEGGFSDAANPDSYDPFLNVG